MKNLTETFKRVLRPTTACAVTITYTESGRLSFVGSGRHGSGQVSGYLIKDKPAPGFTKDDVVRFCHLWERWHLNDMRAGTPKQEEAVRQWRKVSKNASYKDTCEMLESINLLFDNGYKYGSKWLKEDVPAEVLEWLFTLPGVGNTFSDLYSLEIDDRVFDAVVGFGK